MGSSHRLLIIDDDQSVLKLLENYLANANYDVICVSNSLDALKKVETDANGFDLIITDLVMPEISGIGLISILKKEHSEIPIIAITGKGAEPEKLSLEAKADGILQKPFEMEALGTMINSMLSK